jgi:hypothetical protein
MGKGGTTTTTTIPDPTPEERALLAKSGALSDAALIQMGIYTTRSDTAFEDTADYAAFQKQKTKLQDQLTANAGKLDPKAYQQLQNQLNQINKQEEDARKKFKPSTNIKVYEAPSQEIKSIIDKYGVESDQYKQALESYRQETGAKEKNLQELEAMSIQKSKDFLNGNFGLKEGEQKFFDEIINPMKDAALNAIDYVTNQAKETNKSVSEAISEFENRVKETGMDMDTALMALEDRVKQTGVDMGKALDEELSLTRELTKMGIDDFTNAERMRLSNQAASLGRSSTDPKFISELVANSDREIAKANLQTGIYGAQQKMGIAERTGSGLESAQNMRMGIAERTGAGLEGAAQSRIGLAQETGNTMQQIAGQKGQLELGMVDTASQLRQQLAYGMAPSQVGLGMNVGQYQNALVQQKIANTSAAAQAPLSLYEMQQRERMAQTTVTEKKSTGFGDVLGGVIGAGVGAASAYTGISSAGSLAKMAAK